MSKRKNNPILDMYRKKQNNIDNPPVIPSPVSTTEIIEDQEDQSICKVLKIILIKKIGKNRLTGYIIMLKRVELFVRYVKNFLVVIIVLYKNQKVFLYVLHL